MKHKDRGELIELGLSPTEAQIYLVLVESGTLSAGAVATATGLSRTAVYQILCALTDKGLIESGAGYGSKFVAVPPEQALPRLVAREEEALAHRREVADALSRRLATLAESIEAPAGELIQVIRSPRAVLERFESLQLQAEQQIEVFSKPPYFNRGGNEAEEKALRRGVRARAIYEKGGLEDPSIGPHFHNWVAAGEEARIYDGELPHKMVIFDARIVLMPLIMPGQQMRALLIRNAHLAESLSLAFQFIWDRSQPLVRPASRKSKPARMPVINRAGRNGSHDSTPA